MDALRGGRLVHVVAEQLCKRVAVVCGMLFVVASNVCVVRPLVVDDLASPGSKTREPPDELPADQVMAPVILCELVLRHSRLAVPVAELDIVC